jgi:hypothetical protein
MPRYILAFRGGMPKTPQEGQKMMQDWNGWTSALGKALADPGAGFGKSRFLTSPTHETTASDPLSGYCIVDAADHDAAVAMAAKNPIFSLGGTIEVVPEKKF